MLTFKIAELKNFQKEVSKIDSKLYKKIKLLVYPQLKNNPFFGTNIKKLKGNLDNYYRYRLGNYRIFYKIIKQEIKVILVDIQHRQNAYN